MNHWQSLLARLTFSSGPNRSVSIVIVKISRGYIIPPKSIRGQDVFLTAYRLGYIDKQIKAAAWLVGCYAVIALSGSAIGSFFR